MEKTLGADPMKKTNILVLRMKEILYIAIFLLLSIFLIFLMIHMFTRNKSGDATATYTPGVYTSEMSLGGRTVNVEVTVDADHINSVRVVDLSDSVAAMYPLIEPAMESLSEQIVSTQSLDDITYDDSTRYTSEALLSVIEDTLEKAKK